VCSTASLPISRLCLAAFFIDTGLLRSHLDHHTKQHITDSLLYLDNIADKARNKMSNLTLVRAGGA
jgi:hypothetical protein